MLNLILGGASVWLGLTAGSIALWGFGAACLLQVLPALNLHRRILEGLGNNGLERERLTLKVVSHLLRLLALGMAMASVSALLGERSPQPDFTLLGLALLALGIQAALWQLKRGLADIHLALDLDAARNRTMLVAAALLLTGTFLGRWFPGSDAITSLGLALLLFLQGRSLAKGTSLQAAACGGCGNGCG